MSTSTSLKENLKSQQHSLYSIHDEYFNDSDRIRERIVSTSFRRASRSNTSDNYLRDREILTYAYNIPTIFRYNQDTFEEKPCPSIDEIPEINENECIWIDVIGVSKTMNLIIEIIIDLDSCIEKISFPVLVNDLTFIH